MLDEPFGALDAFTREELWCVIRDLQAARKITIVLVTHDLREACSSPTASSSCRRGRAACSPSASSISRARAISK